MKKAPLFILSILLLVSCGTSNLTEPIIDPPEIETEPSTKETIKNSNSLLLEDFDLAIEYPEKYRAEERPESTEFTEDSIVYKFINKQLENTQFNAYENRHEFHNVHFGLSISTPQSIDAFIQKNQGEQYCLDHFICEENYDWNEFQEIYSNQKNIIETQKEYDVNGPKYYEGFDHEHLLKSPEFYELKTFNKKNYLIFNDRNTISRATRVYITFVEDVRVEIYISWLTDAGMDESPPHEFDKEADEVAAQLNIYQVKEAQEPIIQASILIDEGDNFCEQDSDCITAMTDCSCDCGIPINEKHWDKYLDAQGEKCQNYTGPMCDMMCPEKPLICISNTCTYSPISLFYLI